MDERLSLKSRIEIELKSYDGLMGIYIDDLSGTVIEKNADEVYETASTIKVFILATLFRQIEQGKKSLNELLPFMESQFVDGSGVTNSLELGTMLSVKNWATLMIIVSDNIATNVMIDYLGLDTINEEIKALGFLDTKLLHPLHFEQYHGMGLGKTTPRDYGRCFAMIAKGKLVSQKASRQMHDILKQQHYNTMLTKAFPPYYLDPDNYSEQLITIASKSGSMDACRNDGGIFTTPYGSYVIVMLNKNYSDPMYYHEHPAIVTGSKISRLVFEQYIALEGTLTK